LQGHIGKQTADRGRDLPVGERDRYPRCDVRIGVSGSDLTRIRFADEVQGP
jgi:hypothetical protein